MGETSQKTLDRRMMYVIMDLREMWWEGVN
jgi:hypothetical protein